MFKGFREFIMRGNVVDLAVAVVIGAAFGAVVKAFVDALITPIIGAVFGQPDFSGPSLHDQRQRVPVRLFINALISFLLIAAGRLLRRRRADEQARRAARARQGPRDRRQCPECLSEIPHGARASAPSAARRSSTRRRRPEPRFWYVLLSSAHLSPEGPTTHVPAAPRHRRPPGRDAQRRRRVRHARRSSWRATRSRASSTSTSTGWRRTTRTRWRSSGCPDRARLLDLLRLLANNPLERVSPHRGAPATCSRAASACTSSSRASTTSGGAGTASSSCAPRRPPSPATSGRCAPSARRSRRSAGSCATSTATSPRTSTGGRPRVYRQVAAGAEVGVYAVPQKWPAPPRYRELLAGIPFVRNLLMYPPLLLDPPTNTRTGQFTEVADNPLDGLTLEREQWLCYPALVGRLVVFVYFHQRFAGLGLLARQPLRARLGRGDRRRARRRVPLRRARRRRWPASASCRPSSTTTPPAACFVARRAARGPLRLLRLPQEDGPHAAQRRRHGPRAHAVPRRLHAARARGRQRRQRAPHRRHGDRQVGDARGAARRRRRAHPRGARRSPTTWGRSRSAPTAACSATAPRSAPSCGSTTCSRATPSGRSTAPSS